MFKNNKRITSLGNPYRNRLIFMAAVFCAFFMILTTRLFSFQVSSHERLIHLTQKQDSKTIRLASPRGTIFDAKERALAVSIRVPSVFVDPNILSIDAEKEKVLLKTLNLSKKEWNQKIKDKDKRFVWVKRKIDPSYTKDLEELDIRGIGILHEWRRMYPDRENGAQVLGFVNADGQGVEGLEKQYDDFLYSHIIEIQSKKDARGRAILYGQNIDLERRKGFDIHLTIDSTLQHFLEEELVHAAVETNVESAMGILMDPHTGQIKAMASYPRMNPNRIDKSNPMGRKNRNVLDTYEPGSTFKAFVMLEALEQNLIKLDEVMDCREESLVIAGKRFRNPVKDKDWLTAKGVIKYSNNVCMAKIGLKMGKPGLSKMIQHLEFAKKTGIDFSSEASGIFSDTPVWRDSRIANLAFGQGISVTAIQMVQAMALIANGGFKVQPYMVEKMVTGTGEVISIAPQVGKKRLYSQKTIEIMQEFLLSATQEDGTGKNASVEGYSVAGKTGTAQIFDFEKKAYSHKEVVSSFLGYAPAKSPQLIGYIVLVKPEKSEHGGTIAAPVFRNIMRKVLPYLKIEKS